MMTQSTEQPFFCCVPGKYLEVSKFEEKLEKLEDKLIDQTLKPFEPSGHAFVCLDSTGSAKVCSEHFTVTAFDYVKHSCVMIWEMIVSCFGLIKSSDLARGRSKSTLFKYNDQDKEDEELFKHYDKSIMIARTAAEPADILWKNMRG